MSSTKFYQYLNPKNNRHLPMARACHHLMCNAVPLVFRITEPKLDYLSGDSDSAQSAMLKLLLPLLKSQAGPAKFRKHNSVVKFVLRSAVAKNSERRNPSKTPHSSAKIKEAPEMVKCSLLPIMYSIFLRIWEGRTAVFSMNFQPL